MASSYKIPKKKLPVGSDSAPLHMQSPLSRLQGPSPQSCGDRSGRGGANRALCRSTPGTSANGQSVFQDVAKNVLGVCNPSRALSANHRAAGIDSDQSQPGKTSCLSNGWRPKRASDRLLPPAQASRLHSPPQKKKRDLGGEVSGLSPASKSVSVKSVDSLAELRPQQPITEQSCRISPEKKNSSEHHFLSKTPLDRGLCRSPISTATPEKRRSLGRTPWHGSSDRLGDPRERERRKWNEFRDLKKTRTSSAVLHLRLRRQEKQTEPIVLSSEEDEEEEKEGHRRTPETERTPQSSSTGAEPGLRDAEVEQARQAASSKGETKVCKTPPPSFLLLEFSSLHAGLTHADANGQLLVTEHGITVPLKGVGEGEVTVVASQLRGYGVWDGGVAKGGTLLAQWSGPAPSLLFLWVTEAQANLLQRELPDIQSTAGPSCPVLLLVLQEQLQELQAALLSSILDMDEYRKGRCSSSPSSPMEWTDGLLLLHSCPPPLDQHLLALLGHSQEESSGSSRSRSKQQLSSRLIQYPPAPCRGRISVCTEDLACLDHGEFLNDVIIDFYLKYLLLEGVGGPVAGRSHVFSSFFFKQLSRRRAAGEDDAPSVPDRHVRHQRVKTWTRHVDVFTKDFLFVPVNQEAHWFLVVVCFPGLEEVQYVEFQSPKGESGDRRPVSQRAPPPPDCTEQGRQRNTVLKRSCVLVMDSLKLSYHESVCRLLREYLQVEWEVRRGTPRVFTSDSMRSSNCRVPLQDNSSDCGLYLLQYAESFLQNPVVHFDLPLHLESWFPRQRVRQKREEIRSLILSLHRSQRHQNAT